MYRRRSTQVVKQPWHAHGSDWKPFFFTISIESVAMMPCNPNIGGSSKGHLVKEVDALGGEMGKVIDRTFIQSKMLNSSKGPAVHSLRAQADKANYSKTMRKVLEVRRIWKSSRWK